MADSRDSLIPAVRQNPSIPRKLEEMAQVGTAQIKAEWVG
jgi:hypothetical protein